MRIPYFTPAPLAVQTATGRMATLQTLAHGLPCMRGVTVRLQQADG